MHKLRSRRQLHKRSAQNGKTHSTKRAIPTQKHGARGSLQASETAQDLLGIFQQRAAQISVME